MVTGNAAAKANEGAMESIVSTADASQSGDVDSMAAKCPGEEASEVAANVNLTGNCINYENIPSPAMKESVRSIDLASVNNKTTASISCEAKMEASSETKFDTKSKNEGITAGIEKLDVNHNHSRGSSNSNASTNTTQTLHATTANPGDATDSTDEMGMAIVKQSGTDSKSHATPILRPQQQQLPLLPIAKPKRNAPAPQAVAPTTATASAPHAPYTSNHLMEFEDEYSDSNDTLLTMSFNQDGGCLAIGTGSGFRICNVHPYQETFRRNLGGAGGSNAIEGGKLCRYHHAAKIFLHRMFRCLVIVLSHT